MTDLARPILWQATLATTLVAAAGGALGSLGYAHGGTLRAGLAALADALPDHARRYLTPIGATVALQLLAGLVAVGVALVLGAGRVADLYGALGGGVFGAVMVTLLQLLLLPNLAIWAASALAGPGFAVGVGTEVSPLTSTLGPLPAVPALGAADPGPMPGFRRSRWWCAACWPVPSGGCSCGARVSWSGAHRCWMVCRTSCCSRSAAAWCSASSPGSAGDRPDRVG